MLYPDGVRVVWALALIVAVLAASLGGFWLAVRPPRIVLAATPRDYRLSFEDVTIATDDGLRLAAWLIPAATGRTPRTTVVLLHGYPADKADLLPIAAALHSEFTTLLVDLRYFGKSEGGATTLGHRERRDLARAVDFLARRGLDRVGVFGYSLGGAIALMGAAEDARIRAVAAYAPFSDLRLLGRDVYSHLWLLKGPLVGLMVFWGRLFLGADITRPSPATAAERLRIPVLLMHSRDDEQIPFRHAERLAQALRTNPRAELVFGRGLHNDALADLPSHLTTFFSATLR